MTLRIGSIALLQRRQENLEERVQQLTRMAADILVVAGFRTGMDGMQLRATLDRLGLIYQTPCDTEPHESAIILAARCPFLEIDLPPTAAPHRRHCLHVGIADFRLLAWDLMGAPAAASLRQSLLAQAEDLLRDKGLILSRSRDVLQSPPPEAPAAEPPVEPDDLSSAFVELGYLDASQLASGPHGAGETGDGPAFKTLVTPALAPRMSDCYQAGDGGATPSKHGWETAVLRVG